MPQTLYLLRHAKSSWKDDSLSDFERPLKSRGRDAAKLVGKKLASEEPRPQLIVCSPAARTRETLKLVIKKSGLQVEQRFDERIYEASLRDLLQVVSEIPEEVSVALLIGHNPGFEELLSYLTGELRPMPTAALAKIKLDVASWKDVRPSEASLESFVTPKELDD